VGNALGVAVIQRSEDLLEDLGSRLLGEAFVLDNPLEQLASLAELCNQVDILLIFEVLIELQHAGMIQSL